LQKFHVDALVVLGPEGRIHHDRIELLVKPKPNSTANVEKCNRTRPVRHPVHVTLHGVDVADALVLDVFPEDVQCICVHLETDHHGCVQYGGADREGATSAPQVRHRLARDVPVLRLQSTITRVHHRHDCHTCMVCSTWQPRCGGVTYCSSATFGLSNVEMDCKRSSKRLNFKQGHILILFVVVVEARQHWQDQVPKRGVL
jgi:hypothetical protein